MIQIVLYKKDKLIHAFEISGHANSGPYGYDLVCAGVSAVSFGAINAVMELCEKELIIKQEDDGGYLYMELPKSLLHMEQAQIILQAMVISLETIERNYHQFIQIKKS